MGFIASGDHNSIGVGIAAVWVKEISQRGIVEGLKNRRCFATTGDKIFIHMTVNGSWANEEAVLNGEVPKIEFEIESTDKIKSIELLRNSVVIERIKADVNYHFKGSTKNEGYSPSNGSQYYYLRIIQDNDHIGWSSTVWVRHA